MPTPRSISELNVLIVDDNRHHRLLLAEILRAAGAARILAVDTAEEALAELRRSTPGVVILDWGIEPIDGVELTRRIRRGQAGVDKMVPIVMVTARSTIADVEVARRAGVHEYAIKPVSSAALLARIEAAALRPRRFVDSPVYVGPCRRRVKIKEYQGPRRRLSDPAGSAAARARSGASVSRIAEAAQGFDPRDHGQVRAVYSCSRETRAIAQEVGDAPLDRSAGSLMRYMEGVGATARLDPEVVTTHVQAMAKLGALPDSDSAAREQVAAGLEYVVEKKLRQTPSETAA